MSQGTAMADDDAHAPDRQTKAKIFISYSRKNMAFADRLEAALRERGLEPLIDRTEIYAFEDWWKRIQALITQADTVIFVLSPDSVASEICAREVTFASSINKRLAPVVYRRVNDEKVPEPLARLNFIFFDDEARFDDSLNRLSEALATDIEWIRKHTEYGQAALQWAAANRPGGLLLRSPALEKAERWIAARPANAPAATDLTQTFIAESRRGATRRRSVLTGSLAAGLVLALGLAALAYWQREVAVEQQRMAEQQRQEALTQRDRAENILLTTVGSANDLAINFGVRLRQTIGVPTALANEFLKKLMGMQQGLVKYDAPNIDLKRALAVTLRAQSQAFYNEGDYAQALYQAQQSTKIIQSLMSPTRTDPDLDFELSHSLDREGEALSAQGEHKDALERFQHALTIRQLLAFSHAKVAGTAEARQRDLAVALERTGDEYDAMQLLDEAADLYQASFKIRDSQYKARPDDPEAAEDLAVGYDRLAHLDEEQNLNDPTSELKKVVRAIEIREKLVSQNRLNSDWQDSLAFDYATAGRIWLLQGDKQSALDSLQKALHIRQFMADWNPDVPKWQRELAETLFYLAQCDSPSRQRLQQIIDILGKLESQGKLTAEMAELRAETQSLLTNLLQ